MQVTHFGLGENVFDDDSIAEEWREYHRKNARLRLDFGW
jgi:hypothetical protein